VQLHGQKPPGYSPGTLSTGTDQYEHSFMKKPLIGLTMDCSPSSDERPFAKGVDVYYQNSAYIRFLETVDCVHVLLPTLSDVRAAASVIATLDGLLLTGGNDVDSRSYGEEPIADDWQVDTPRTQYELALVNEAQKQGKPILGICRGCQMLNVALGGSLFQDIRQQVPNSIVHASPHKPVWNYHEVEVEANSRLFSIFGKRKLSVTTSHHQAIKDLAPGLRVIASAADGVIEAVQMDEGPFTLGVQWHPEAMADLSLSIPILQAFVENCSNGRA